MIAEHIQGRIDTISNEIQRDLIIELKDALKYPAGNVGRRLDNRWFHIRYIVLWIDWCGESARQEDFYGTCGEIRFVYRLAYIDDSGASSRLPLTLNVVMEPIETDCIAVARQWAQPDGMDDDAWLTETTDAINTKNLRFKQLELNAQIVRFPSGLETEFAGQALYLLRVYGLEEIDGSLSLVEIPLENTPNVQALNSDSTLKQSFIEWANTNTKAIDNGTHLIPEQFSGNGSHFLFNTGNTSESQQTI